MDIDAIINADGNIYKTWIPGYDVTFNYRLLSLKEYQVFRGLRETGVATEYQIAEQVFERCFFGEAALISVDLPAGITISIGQLILYLSGDCDDISLKEDIQRIRQMHPPNTVFEHMRAVICTAFSYKIEDIDSWSRPKFLKRFTIAENVLAKQNPEFVRLNLKDIKSKEELERESKKPAGGKIDFAKENRAIGQAVGVINQEEAQAELTSKQLRTLSRKSQMTRGR